MLYRIQSATLRSKALVNGGRGRGIPFVRDVRSVVIGVGNLDRASKWGQRARQSTLVSQIRPLIGGVLQGVEGLHRGDRGCACQADLRMSLQLSTRP